MQKLILVLLVVSAVLVADTEGGGWFRRSWNKFKSGVKTVAGKAKNATVRFKNWVKSKVGKRQAGLCPCADQLPQPIILGLEETCQDFGVNSQSGLTRASYEDAFDQNDDNKDGTLDEDEIARLKAYIEIYEKCVQRK
ncbi:uncharacterized protein [Littorina saxatilis]|uniref:EF-hand domain-containing protein n=1 Tax=Littorina saxatilis TaxID=31220 RepID=A0AAN9G9K1_9CAEN